MTRRARSLLPCGRQRHPDHLSLAPAAVICSQGRADLVLCRPADADSYRPGSSQARFVAGVTDKAGGNRIDSIRYESSDLSKYRDQARDLVMKAAHEKADALAKALGQQIGKAQMIDEVPEYSDVTRGRLTNEVGWGAEKRLAVESSTATGQQSISASVVVSFELM